MPALETASHLLGPTIFFFFFLTFRSRVTFKYYSSVETITTSLAALFCNGFVTRADVKSRYGISRPMSISTWYINIRDIAITNKFLEEGGKQKKK